MKWPNMNDPVDALAHCLSEIIDDGAPIGWEKHRGTARCLLGIFRIEARAEKDAWIKDKYGEVFPKIETATPPGYVLVREEASGETSWALVKTLEAMGCVGVTQKHGNDIYRAMIQAAKEEG